MNKKAKVYLTISLTMVVLGVIMGMMSPSSGMPPQVYVILPVGAVFFGLFLVSAFLANEADQHTKEQDEFQKHVDSHSGKA